MTLLIVDDEYYLVQGTKNSLNWKEYGIDTVLCAYSAEQAMSLYEENEIDILLADVEMPRENGLSLIRRVIEEGYESVNILLTGHANFDYAKEAIQLKVFDYLLKPVEPAQLILVITRAAEEIARHRNENAAAKSIRREHFWQSLYSGEIPDDVDSISQYLVENKLDDISVEGRYYYSYLSVRRIGMRGEELMPEAAPALQNSIRGLLLKESCIAAADRKGYMISTLVTPEFVEDDLRSRAAELIRVLGHNHPDCRFVLYTFTEAPLTAAPYAYELLSQYALRILASQDKVISVTELQKGAGMKTENAASSLPLDTWKEWLLQGRQEDILVQIKGLLRHQDTVYSAKYLSSVFYGLMGVLFSVFSEKNLSPEETLSRTAESIDFSQAASSPENLIRWAGMLLRETASHLEEEEEAGSVMAKVRQYVGEHLQDPELDRNSIASAVHISPDYLSYLFHKESGSVLSAYITEERIALARKLLLSGDLTSQEIAERVGFSNGPYFHRQFKKIMGMTPSAYRTQYRKKQ